MPTFKKTKGSDSRTVTYRGREYTIVPTRLGGNKGWDLKAAGKHLELSLKTLKEATNTVEFHGKVSDYLEGIGATLTGKFRDYSLETPLGTLELHVRNHTIFSVFLDAERAGVQLRKVSANGKWNFHYGEGVPVDNMVARFKYSLDRVMSMKAIESTYMVNGHLDGGGTFDGPVCKNTQEALDAYMEATPDTKCPIFMNRKDNDGEMKEVSSATLINFLYLRAYQDSGRPLLG